MNSLVKKFYQVGEGKGERDGRFREVVFLTERPDLAWDMIARKAPDLPRGWFELSRLPPLDRIEFTRDFWLDRLPFNPGTHQALAEFFERLGDVSVALSRTHSGEELVPELIYSLADESSFFRGMPPAGEEEISDLKVDIGGDFLPRDYMAFLHMHNGFGKLSELGILPAREVPDARRRVLELFSKAERPLFSNGAHVDPGALIPFYESSGLSSYQCFHADWYPGGEMGNVYLSGIDYTISDTGDRKTWADNRAFPTFLEWLGYFLEGMELAP